MARVQENTMEGDTDFQVWAPELCSWAKHKFL